MWKIFRNAFWVPYDDVFFYPTVKKAQQAVAQYCEKNGFSYEFSGDDSVVINGKEHEICRVYDWVGRGYGVKCREK